MWIYSFKGTSLLQACIMQLVAEIKMKVKIAASVLETHTDFIPSLNILAFQSYFDPFYSWNNTCFEHEMASSFQRP